MVKIVTNHVPRLLMYYCELTEKEQDEASESEWDKEFIRYRGEIYPLSDFVVVKNNPWNSNIEEFSEWDGYLSDSFYSGVVIRYVDSDRVILGTYYSALICIVAMICHLVARF